MPTDKQIGDEAKRLRDAKRAFEKATKELEAHRAKERGLISAQAKARQEFAAAQTRFKSLAEEDETT